MGKEASEDWRLPMRRLPRRLPGMALLVLLAVTSLRSDALASRGFGVLKMVRFSLHRALLKRRRTTHMMTNIKISPTSTPIIVGSDSACMELLLQTKEAPV